jgi:hypothetical protein
MVETPDFDQIARASFDRWGPDDGVQRGLMIEDIAEQLRQIWNARGAADLAKIENVTQHAVALIRGEYGVESVSADELEQALGALRSLDG